MVAKLYIRWRHVVDLRGQYPRHGQDNVRLSSVRTGFDRCGLATAVRRRAGGRVGTTDLPRRVHLQVRVWPWPLATH